MSCKRRTHWQRLEAQAERALTAVEERDEPASVKDLNGLYRLLARLQAERELEEARRLTAE